ncbi:DUF1499 domain-containing protein [Aliidiomarina minuta]|uniref:DUF1499 domain-containing protein n=1 Tax=Aliidiomarina minuta TaxID=880057 RepID=A0A432W580_9GAMM|nr:DUF1499 domain-containing protein [Aliidiomarina minuta]RUO25217.1 DUF1499 domain-containing protein [Aliidiomarina minuta]
MKALSFALALCLTIVAIATAILSGPLYQSGQIQLEGALQALQLASVLAVAGALCGILAAILIRPRKPFMQGILALCLLSAGVSFYVTYTTLQDAREAPHISDVTTDTENPPQFDALLSRRQEARVPHEYPGEQIAELQRQHYSDIQTLHTNVTSASVFRAAQQVVQTKGWQLVAVDNDGGIIEASDTTSWLGFEQDIVIRIQHDGRSTVVDVRSVSRNEEQDLGTNAKRVRAFLHELQGRLGIAG